jgi:phage tail sheath gpL-like
MSASIILTGLGAQFPNPGVYAQVNFAAGPSGPAPGARNIIIFGNQTTAGTATNDTVVYGPDTQTPIQTEQDWINLFGAGGHHHRAFLRVTAVLGNNSPIGIYGISVTPSAGAAATATMTIATTATSNGNHRFWCVDQYVDTPITSGQTATQIATAIVSSINSQFRWPITAANTAGAITLTAVNKGPEGNWILVQALITPGAATIGTTTTLTANTNLSGGTTADTIAAALATIASTRYYYQILHDTDATNIGLAVTQANTLALPTTGIRQRVSAGSRDTLANEIALATGLNAARAELSSALGSDLTGLEIAANNCAIYALFESSGSAYGPGRDNFSLFPTPAGGFWSNDPSYWHLIPSRSVATTGLTQANVTSALNNGITPLQPINNNSAIQLVKRITTRSLNGANQDYRVRDAHRVSVPDWWTDDAVYLTQNNYGGMNIAPNPQQGVPFPPNCTCPIFWGAALQGLVRNYEAAGQLKNGNQIIAGMITQQETNPPDRMSNLTPLQVIDLADQFFILVNQVA